MFPCAFVFGLGLENGRKHHLGSRQLTFLIAADRFLSTGLRTVQVGEIVASDCAMGMDLGILGVGFLRNQGGGGGLGLWPFFELQVGTKEADTGSRPSRIDSGGASKSLCR